MLAGLMAKHRLMINFHGSTKPMGEGRTWPHFMTAEGIMGMEHYKWSDMPNARHNCTVPFTRNVSGPMDYTPLGFSNANRNTTHAHQLALPVVFDSGVTHYCASIFYLEPWMGTRFIRRTRAHYDEVRLLKGYPGRDVAMLRRKGEEYLLGIITTLKQTTTIALDFLPEGTWEAEIYEDGDKDHLLRLSTRTVTRDDTLVLPLMENGGAAVYIARQLREPEGGVQAGWMCDRVQALSLSDARLRGGSEPMRWTSDLSGVLLCGSAEVTARADEAGLYTLRLTYTSERDWQLQVRSGVDSVETAMPASRSHWDMLTQDGWRRARARFAAPDRQPSAADRGLSGLRGAAGPRRGADRKARRRMGRHRSGRQRGPDLPPRHRAGGGPLHPEHRLLRRREPGRLHRVQRRQPHRHLPPQHRRMGVPHLEELRREGGAGRAAGRRERNPPVQRPRPHVPHPQNIADARRGLTGRATSG